MRDHWPDALRSLLPATSHLLLGLAVAAGGSLTGACHDGPGFSDPPNPADQSGESGISDSLSDTDSSPSEPDHPDADDAGSGCEDPCEPDLQACDPEGAVITCIDDDGCARWGPGIPCTPGMLCDGGSCVAPTRSQFATTPLPWSVPARGSVAGGLLTPEGAPSALGDDFWSLLDLDGDGHLDLVITGRAVSKQGHPWYPRTPGHPHNPHWEVYPGSDVGFAAAPIAWFLPSEGSQDHGMVAVDGAPTQAGDSYWTLRDLDGDGRPELVITGRAFAQGDGWIGRSLGYPKTPHWEVYRNLGDRFAATPVPWVLPPESGPAGRGFVTAEGLPAALGDPAWELRDLDGDGSLDLLVTGKAVTEDDDGLRIRALGAASNPYWEVYPGGEGGFGSVAAWLVPTGGAALRGFFRGESPPLAAGDDTWRLRDLDGDGLADLVVTARATAITTEGWRGATPGLPENPHWEVYRNLGDAFDRSPTPWALPLGGRSGEGFVDLTGETTAPGDQAWSTLDLDGDGRPELVITAEWRASQPTSCRGQVLGFADDAPRWAVFSTAMGGDGFDRVPWALTVPAIGLQACGLRAPSGEPLGHGDHQWFTAALHRGRPLDLVITARGVGTPPTSQVVGFNTTPRWERYPGGL